MNRVPADHPKLVFTLVLFAWLGMSRGSVYAQPDEAKIVLDPASLRSERVCIEAGTWRYRPGDDPAWADPGLDDRDWEVVSTGLAPGASPEGGWPGIGWFRLRVTVDPSLWNRPLLLIISQSGASEVYVNGELRAALGKVAPNATAEEAFVADRPVLRPVVFPERSEHVIAVRYSNFAASRIHKRGGNAGFAVSFAGKEYAEIYERETIWFARYQMFFTAAALAFALLHFLLFVFYPRHRGNLYYALLTASCAGLAYFPIQTAIIHDLEVYARNFTLFELSMIGASVFGCLFLYSLYYERMPRHFWLFPAAGGLLAILSSQLDFRIYYAFPIVAFLAMSRVIWRAVRERRRWALVIGLGYAAFIAGCTYQIVVELMARGQPFFPAYLYGILLLLISMSIFLAHVFAVTGKHLERQLAQVRELSEKNLEQERVAREKEVERVLLEEDLRDKERELEKAEALRKAHNELEKAHGDLERAHAELKATQGKLVQSEKIASLGMLVAGIAHEINTPVGAASSMHQTLVKAAGRLDQLLATDSGMDVETKQSMQRQLEIIAEANQIIRSGNERVADIVRKLRSFARLDEAELKKVDIHQAIEDTLSLLESELKDRVSVVRRYGDLPQVACFPAQLNQAFLNLLINAKQAITERPLPADRSRPPEGEIVITTSRGDGMVLIDIADTGIGIPEEHLPRIFDPGFTTKGVRVGTGLGLPICYQIIQSHRGEIRVASQVGEGTTVSVVLPTDLDVQLGRREQQGSPQAAETGRTGASSKALSDPGGSWHNLSP